MILPDGTGYLIDFKFGRKPVDHARENIQGQAYAAGAFRKFPNLKSLRVVFLCPRQDEENESCVFHRSDIPQILMRIASIKAAVRQKNAPYCPSDRVCLFCGRRASCPALAGPALVVANEYGGLPLPSQFNPGMMLTPEDRARAQAAAAVLEKWAEEVRADNLRAVVEEGITIPGYALVHRGGSRRVLAMIPLLDELEKYGVTLNDFLSRCTIKVGEVESLVSYAVEVLAGQSTTALDANIANAMKGGTKAVLNQLNQRLEETQIVQRGNEIFYLTKTNKKQERNCNGKSEIGSGR
jgi:hypothetical protein